MPDLSQRLNRPCIHYPQREHAKVKRREEARKREHLKRLLVEHTVRAGPQEAQARTALLGKVLAEGMQMRREDALAKVLRSRQEQSRGARSGLSYRFVARPPPSEGGEEKVGN